MTLVFPSLPTLPLSPPSSLTPFSPPSPPLPSPPLSLSLSLGLCSGILVGAFIFGVALAAIPLGHVADLYGRKGVMMLGLLTAAISAISYGLANNFWVAFFLRFFGGEFFVCVFGFVWE